MVKTKTFGCGCVDGEEFILCPKHEKELSEGPNVVWEDAHGAIPINHDLHHKDHDKTNNKLENLELYPNAACWSDRKGNFILYECNVEGCTCVKFKEANP